MGGAIALKKLEISSRKKALVLSIAVISLCFSVLVGVTLALFTNELDDGTIGINTTAGSIDIRIVDVNNNDLVGEVLYFDKEEGGTKKILWEPGATFVTEGFKIYNNGTIPVKYQVYVNSSQADSELIDVLDFWITDDPNSIPASDPNEVPVQSFKGDLGAGGESDIYFLVVRMDPDAGNFYQGLELNGIGITVHAVQGNVESDDIDFSTDNGFPAEENKDS